MNIYRDITAKQKKILRFIQNKISQEGKPPTIREIALWFGFKSTGTVRDYLNILIKKGYLKKKTPKKSRAIELAKNIALRIPVLGSIHAGVPNLAYEEIDEYLTVEDFFPSSGQDMFALRIKGDSMIDKQIFEDDLVIVKKQVLADNGDIVVALIDEEATVKILRKDNHNLYLEPANKNYPLIKKEFKIIGKVIAAIRKY